MKLKDYKKNPEQYEEIKNICAERGIIANDETEMSEILRQNSSIESAARRAANKLERSRIKNATQNTTAAALRRLADKTENRR